MSAYYLIRIRQSGEVELLPSAPRPSLEKLQSAVGGWIETVRTWLSPGNVVMLIDDEGKIKDTKLNRLATHVARLSAGDCIFGDAVLVLKDGEDLKAIPRALALRIAGRKDDRR